MFTVHDVHTIMDKYIRECTLQKNEYEKTSVLLVRLLARRSNSFRHMRSFRDMCKIRAALSRLKQLDFQRDIDSLRCALPDIALPNGYEVHIPSRNYFEFVLLRSIAVFKIYERILDLCKSVATFCLGQLKQNHFLEINILFVAVVSQLYHVVTALIKLQAKFYNQLLPFRDSFTYNDVQNTNGERCFYTIDSNTQLPEELSFNTDTEIANLLPNQTVVSLSNIDNNTKLVTSNIACNEGVNLLKYKTISHHQKKREKIDFGVEVERTVEDTSNQYKNLLQKLRNISDVKQFIKSESVERKRSLHNSITKNIEDYEWRNVVELFFTKLKDPAEKNKAVRIFCNFLNKKSF